MYLLLINEWRIDFYLKEKCGTILPYRRYRNMLYEKAANINDLKPGEKKKLLLREKEILLVNIDGAFYAVNNKCPHMGASLVEGNLEGSHIICPKHGSVFDVKTGKVMERGKILFINVNAENLTVYPTKIEGEDLFIGIE
ncbi:MAG: hypothetical protein EOM59_01670 [Clostridia bacterium]|nr:hypothetical protein [Clostridia bacterium]